MRQEEKLASYAKCRTAEDKNELLAEEAGALNYLKTTLEVARNEVDAGDVKKVQAECLAAYKAANKFWESTLPEEDIFVDPHELFRALEALHSAIYHVRGVKNDVGQSLLRGMIATLEKEGETVDLLVTSTGMKDHGMFRGAVITPTPQHMADACECALGKGKGVAHLWTSSAFKTSAVSKSMWLPEKTRERVREEIATKPTQPSSYGRSQKKVMKVLATATEIGGMPVEEPMKHVDRILELYAIGGAALSKKEIAVAKALQSYLEDFTEENAALWHKYM